MRRLARSIAAVPHIVVTVLMILAMANMLAGVFLRYVVTWLSVTFDLPTVRFYWVEEVGEFTLAWMSFIAAAIGIRKGVHFSVQLITESFPAGLRRAVYTVHYVLIAGLGAVIALFGWRVAEANSLAASPALDINLRWLYLSAVAGGALMVLYSLAAIADGWRGRWPGHPQPDRVE